MSKRKPWEIIVITLSVIIGIGMFVMLAYCVIIAGAFGMFDKTYDKEELVENFNDNKTEIYDLKRYFNKIVPVGKNVAIELRDITE